GHMATGTRYAGKVVVVTGGGRGIGAGIVRAFVNSGARVVICDKDESGGRALEQELPGAVFILCDVTQEDDVKTLVSETIRRFGRLDCVVNNAGHHPPPQRPEETSAQGFRQLLELNLLGTYTLTKLALPYLRKSQGNVINISSLVGAIGQAQAVPYVATKGAVTAMTKALALDESPYGVRVNCISPGNIWTPLWEELAALMPDPRATIREGMLAQPLGRMGQPAEVGAAAVFLASEANFCTGIELLVTGGAELGYGCKASRSTPVDAPDIPSGS
nr:Chain A, 17-beta-hydroxysteroid dehydrogenase 14 [Homo sapiens]5ICM_A Chain A, 17-beta-hydroxysteroid dehydrogenase 14 [Homo sapiens]5JS6_A Chain A, 17-beta-hydroxysteroid dehydrogenase 14 [Homo sapiens]5L7T_A Chain A, 17-beta-hydroxysteroid dehydrogenase 14 [Homo sapiens]5L7W_A Chain A, 17-beta-hydroxysteroid dehydrogenase 14 [Homo sapiens]5L7Y_A Chain A, 17-beta-hydroxysteroid dehydrogenase 14 [Homo sapiens]5O42_A Chain A, 17-beta-hydroxysteroid dehydrogenase 14 [Homo sapiens]5O43_A Cha